MSERPCTTVSVGALHPGLQCWHAVASAFRQSSPTCRTAFPAQHLRSSGIHSCWPDGLELTPEFYLGSSEQHRLLGICLKRTSSHVTSASSALGVLSDYALYKSTLSITHSRMIFECLSVRFQSRWRCVVCRICRREPTAAWRAYRWTLSAGIWSWVAAATALSGSLTSVFHRPTGKMSDTAPWLPIHMLCLQCLSALMLSGGVLAWLSVSSEVQICIWPSWCHCHSLSLASVKFTLVLPFWYWLTRVVREKGPLNSVCVCAWLPVPASSSGMSTRYQWLASVKCIE